MADSHNTWARKWIEEVERHLADLAPGERAAVIAELDGQLRKLSEQYRTTGTKTVGSAGRKFFKYATLTLLALFGLFVSSIFLIPIVIFKLIAVDNFEKDFTFSFSDHKPRIERMQGKLSANPLNNLTFTMSNGQISVTTDPNSVDVTYECEIESNNTVNQTEAAKVINGEATIVLLNIENADCELTVPSVLPMSINMTNGKISLADVEQNVEANLTSGEIEFEASSKASFEMKASVQTGSVDGLKSFEHKQKNKKRPQYSAALSVGSGRIEIE
jgi:hypothetical protein